jgi:primary-amine oxidase
VGWSFYIGFSCDTGVRLFNIAYKGDRIIYELGLEEAVSHCERSHILLDLLVADPFPCFPDAGNDPIQSGTAYLDSYYGFGALAFELLAGWDCPRCAIAFLTNPVES